MVNDRSLLTRELDRRKAVGLALGTSAGLAAGAAMAQDGTPQASPSASPAIDVNNLPDIVESSVDGVPDVIIRAPEPFASYEGKPANGGSMHFVSMIWGPPVTPRENNTYWQGLEERFGLEELQVTEIPVATYGEKLSALIASGDTGDLVYLNNGYAYAVVNNSLAEGAFTDLTDELTGENLQKYPNLAALPQKMWDESRVHGRIYGVPGTIYQGSNYSFYRKDWADKLGVDGFGTADELYAFEDAVTTGDPNGNGTADEYAQSWNVTHYYGPMFRVPNVWRLNDDGTLTHQCETDEWLAMQDFRRKLWDGGVIHPDAPSNSVEEQSNLFLSNRLGIMTEGFGNFWGANGLIEQIKAVDAGADLQPLVPFGYDGGETFMYPLPPYFGLSAIPAIVGEDIERVREILRVVDYCFAPFGSEEYIFVNFGLEGDHHDVLDDGGRLRNDEGEAQIGGLLSGLSSNGLYIYTPGFPEHSLRQQELSEYALENAVYNPVRMLNSEVQTEKDPVISGILWDAHESYVLGRISRDELLEAVKQWREQGGDEVRADYERLLKEQASATPVS